MNNDRVVSLSPVTERLEGKKIYIKNILLPYMEANRGV